ncbi:hypothetical protein PpBr36_02576 [Pyricularia pennisetigena]|uniref:hypothetical protein n=1 Tax=Pyricularia pennisetigena TaxID=1578925 RepID=UPI0011529F8A|nr:hypothetical protein PpBr36_02576 [Pyricularia pennisetigena]TLS31543.1 hypothetical protein PpBr36_02576 [Pyricularia pennisetigena]
MKLLPTALILLVPALAHVLHPVNTRASSPDRPCGFKIAPCPAGSTCSASDPACPATRGANCPATRGANCPGRCAPATTVTRPRPSHPTRPTVSEPTARSDDEPKPSVHTRTPRPTRSTPPLPTPTPTPTRTRSYDDCGGFRPTPKSCARGQICIDDPYAGGCGMACDMPGICVEPTFCGGIAGVQCADGKMCVDDTRDDCDPANGGSDCGGICV